MGVDGGAGEGPGDEEGHGAFWHVPCDDGAGGEDEDIAGGDAASFLSTRWRLGRYLDVDDLWIQSGLVRVKMIGSILQNVCDSSNVILLRGAVCCYGLLLY